MSPMNFGIGDDFHLFQVTTGRVRPKFWGLRSFLANLRVGSRVKFRLKGKV